MSPTVNSNLRHRSTSSSFSTSLSCIALKSIFDANGNRNKRVRKTTVLRGKVLRLTWFWLGIFPDLYCITAIPNQNWINHFPINSGIFKLNAVSSSCWKNRYWMFDDCNLFLNDNKWFWTSKIRKERIIQQHELKYCKKWVGYVSWSNSPQLILVFFVIFVSCKSVSKSVIESPVLEPRLLCLGAFTPR